jgi:predicted nucleic acid-binding protein
MTGLADACLVIAALQEEDALHERAARHLAREGRLVVPLSAGIELLLGAHRRGRRCVEVLAVCEDAFELESRDVLMTAARALDDGSVKGVFDAVHLAEALHRGTALHTADAALLRTRFPTAPF